MNIYVGNLSFDTTESELESAFDAYGEVTKVNIIKDRETGRSRGFGFVEMSDRRAAQDAINGINDQEISGRTVTVNEAKPRVNRGGGGGDRRW